MEDLETKCKICYSKEDPVSPNDDLISPCNCKGTLKYVHKSCLKMWRYKSQYYSAKKCLQCRTFYKLKDEVTPNSIFLFFCTLLVLFTVHLLISLVLKIFMSNSYLIHTNVELYDLFNVKKPTISYMDLRLHITTLFIYILVFKVVFYNSFLSIFNFVFTYWRIVQLDFFVDKLLYAGLCIYYYKQMYNVLFCRIENYCTSLQDKQS